MKNLRKWSYTCMYVLIRFCGIIIFIYKALPSWLSCVSWNQQIYVSSNVHCVHVFCIKPRFKSKHKFIHNQTTLKTTHFMFMNIHDLKLTIFIVFYPIDLWVTWPGRMKSCMMPLLGTCLLHGLNQRNTFLDLSPSSKPKTQLTSE